jgi:hypothetical protein
MNSISFNTNFTRLLLFKIALIVSISTAVAGGSSVELNRFTEVDTSSANNDNGGFYNASNHPNAFYQRVYPGVYYPIWLDYLNSHPTP